MSAAVCRINVRPFLAKASDHLQRESWLRS